MLTFAGVLQKLLSGYKKAKGVDATGLDLLKLRMQAAEKVRESQRIIPFQYKKPSSIAIDELIKRGDVTLGTAAKTTKKKPPVDPKFEEAVKKQDDRRRDLKDWEARLKTKLEKENKEGAFKIAYNKYLTIDKKPMKMEEIITTYKNLNKYPKGKQYIWDDIAEIEKGEMFNNMGQRSRKQLVERLNKIVGPTKDPFKKPVKEPTGQLEMDFTDWDDKGMAGGGLAYMLGEGGSPKDAANFLNRIAPKGERLAYINSKEEKMLKDAGGSGIMTKQGIPSYTEDDEDIGGAGHHGGGHGIGVDSSPVHGGSSDSDDDQKALSYVNWNQKPTSEPKHGGGEGSWMDFIPGIGMARRAAKFLGPMGDERNLALRHDWLQKQGYLGEGEEDDGKWTSEYLKSPEGLAELKGMGYKTVDDFQPGGKYYHEGSDSYPRYAQQRSSLGLDSIQSTNKDDFDLYAVAEGREPSRFYSGGGSVGMPPMTYGLDFLARYQYPPSEGNTLGQFKDDVFKRLVPDIGINYRSPKGWSFGAGPTIGKGDKTMHFQFRKEFKKGGFNKGRRNFLKLMGGLAALPIVGKYFKLAKPAATAVKAVETSNAAGMPAWFPKLVDKVMKEGKDVSKQYATTERVIVKEAQLPGSKTKILVEQDLTTGNTAVDIGLGKHGWADGRHGQPVRLHLQKGEWIEPKKGQKKGVKTKDEFDVEEAEFTGDAENIKYEESSIEKYGDHGSDFSEVEKYATGKNVDKKIVGKKREADEWAQGQAEADAEKWADEADDFAKGGVAHLLGE